MPDGSRLCGYDEEDGLIAPDIALRMLLDGAAPVAREAAVPGRPAGPGGRFGMPPLQGLA